MREEGVRDSVFGDQVFGVPSDPFDPANPSEPTTEPPTPGALPTGGGRVFLVGAGPGDPGLITVRGRNALAAADVVVYDRLANSRLLGHTRAGCERIYVGKQPGDRTWRQSQINHLLIERARAGQVVCRLKGGDPFVFGRGGEEALALAEADVPFEVVPGVSSAIAAPAYAGIPVTFRGRGAALGIIAGHGETPGQDRDPSQAGAAGEALRYAELARGLDTLVFLMGVENLPGIVEGLVAGGRSPDTPVALIRWGTWSCQETLVGTLATIATQAREAGFRAPAVTVVGEVVRLREKIRWFDNRPLFGRRILVTRAKGQSSELSERLEALGAEPVELPLIRFEPIEDAASPALTGAYDWVLFASANAVSYFWRRLDQAGQDWRALGGARIGAVGPATARALTEHHVRPDFVPSEFEAAQLIAQFPDELTGRRILLPRAEEAPPALPEGLRDAGAKVQIMPVYRNVMDGAGAAGIWQQMEAGALNAVTFTASSTVRHFCQLFPGVDLSRSAVVCIGPSTAATAREWGVPVTAVADPHTMTGLVAALTALFSR
jgi:uroporphyrinogen III methyltransferase / synthase